ncbi:MAG: cupin domain-containing protein [Vicingaceae bacterium]
MNQTPPLQEIITKLDLAPHPEGGFYKETYRSESFIKKDSLSEVYSGERNYSTCIYFVITSESFSAWHKIHQEEIWHFYLGASITIHLISPEGKYSSIVLGNDILNGEIPQYVVKGEWWFAVTVNKENDYALTGCTVAPGFHFDDFILPSRQELLEIFPHLEKEITLLTRV